MAVGAGHSQTTSQDTWKLLLEHSQISVALLGQDELMVLEGEGLVVVSVAEVHSEVVLMVLGWLVVMEPFH